MRAFFPTHLFASSFFFCAVVFRLALCWILIALSNSVHAIICGCVCFFAYEPAYNSHLNTYIICILVDTQNILCYRINWIHTNPMTSTNWQTLATRRKMLCPTLGPFNCVFASINMSSTVYAYPQQSLSDRISVDSFFFVTELKINERTMERTNSQNENEKKKMFSTKCYRWNIVIGLVAVTK